MKVKNILLLAAEITGNDGVKDFIKNGVASDTDTAKRDTEKLLDAYNFVNSELAGEYEKLYIKEKAENVSEVELSALKEYPYEIVSVEGADGFPVRFNIKDGKIALENNGTVVVFYRYIPKKKGLEDEADYGELSRITPRTLALGTAREFLFNCGAYTYAAEVDAKFKQALNACLKPRGRRVIPQRSWFL